jgi:dolichol-phosphate mannosyltransferase
MTSPTLSVIVPLYNEQGNIPELWRRLRDVVSAQELPWELVFVNDGSRDRTAAMLDEIAAGEPRVRVVHLSRNFGHQPALKAGLDHAYGDAMIIMDGDLQDRPEAIPDFIRAWREGAQVVYAVRHSRKESWLYRVLFSGFYRLLSWASGKVRLPVEAGNFGLIDRQVADLVCAMPEHNRYYPGLRAFAGFTQVGVSVERDARFSDKARVGFTGLIRLALDALFSFSYAPIRLFTYVGLIIAGLSFLFLVKVLVHKLMAPEEVALGITSLLMAVLLIGGLQFVMLGVLGEYIGRIYEESKRRPYYIVGKVRNPSSADPSSGHTGH